MGKVAKIAVMDTGRPVREGSKEGKVVRVGKVGLVGKVGKIN